MCILMEMKHLYYIEQWMDFEEKTRDWDWDLKGEYWKIGKEPITHIFTNEDSFKNELLTIIKQGGIISKAYMKEVTDEEFNKNKPQMIYLRGC